MGVYLSKPNTTKNSTHGETTSMHFAVSGMQGWRMTMEDAHIAEPNLTENTALFAVFDGHGGPEVAKFCAKFMPEELVKNPNFKSGNYKRALEEVFLRMDEILMSDTKGDVLRDFKEDPSSEFSMAGCTANVVLVTQKEIYVANAGDSRAILFTFDGEVHAMSIDHKPDLESERQRIQKAGGYVSLGRVNDNLNLSRAIGDLEYKKNTSLAPEHQIISAFPDVMVRTIDPNINFMLIGCDGIWETMETKDICRQIEERVKGAEQPKLVPVLEELLDKLVAKDTSQGFGCDNMSAILVKFKH
jgi:serine/threonine protein phosphatase PrpC